MKLVKVLSLTRIDNGIVVLPESREERAGGFALSFVAIRNNVDFGDLEDLSSSATFHGSFAFGILVVCQGRWLSHVD